MFTFLSAVGFLLAATRTLRIGREMGNKRQGKEKNKLKRVFFKSNLRQRKQSRRLQAGLAEQQLCRAAVPLPALSQEPGGIRDFAKAEARKGMVQTLGSEGRKRKRRRVSGRGEGREKVQYIQLDASTSPQPLLLSLSPS